jgi:hypothetical protein
MWAMVLGVLGSYVDDDLKQPVGVAAAVVYGIYVVLYFVSGASRALCNMESQASVRDYARRLRALRARIKIWIQCYHLETTVTREWVRDRDASLLQSIMGCDGHYETTTHTKKVVTHAAESYWSENRVQDTSGPAPSFPDTPLVQLRVQKVLDFSSAAARAAFDKWRADFIAANNRDTLHVKGFDVDLQGLDRAHIMMRSDAAAERACSCTNSLLHGVLVLLGVAAVYELCILRRIPRAKMLIVKTVFVD